MINTIDYMFGLLHNYLEDQLNITYTIKFSNSHELDCLHVEIKTKISGLNKFYERMYSPYLSFRGGESFIKFTDNCKYRNLDLKNYEFIKLDFLKNEYETEFVFTVSHIIMDGMSVIAIVHYLLNSYSVDTIIDYVNYYEIKQGFSNFLKGNAFRRSKASHLTKFLKPIIKGNKEHLPIISLKENYENVKSSPEIVRTTFDLSVAREKSREYGISRENYLLLKLAETIFKFYNNHDSANTCLISHTMNLRLNLINLTNETLGNYSGRRIVRFDRQNGHAFKEYVKEYNKELADKSSFLELIQEWHSLQKLNRLPGTLLNWIIRRMNNPSNFTATFTYMPFRAAILMPVAFLKRYQTELIDYSFYLRVARQIVPYFMVLPDTRSNYSILLTFNEAYMNKAKAGKLLDLYKDLLVNG